MYRFSPMRTINGTASSAILKCFLDRHVEALIVVANWLFVDIHLLADIGKRNIPAATIGGNYGRYRKFGHGGQ